MAGVRIRVALDRAALALVAQGIGKQARYAAAVALTRTAKDIAAAAPDQAERELGGLTTRFTRQGLYTEPARRDQLVATVGYKRLQAAYMAYQVRGGDRAPRRQAQRLPAEVRLDAFGNIPRGTIAALIDRARLGRRARSLEELAQQWAAQARSERPGARRALKRRGIGPADEIFYGVPRGRRSLPAGLYQRTAGANWRGRKLRPLIVFPKRSVHYRPRFGWEAWGRARAVRVLPGYLAEAMRQAAATAR